MVEIYNLSNDDEAMTFSMTAKPNDLPNDDVDFTHSKL